MKRRQIVAGLTSTSLLGLAGCSELDGLLGNDFVDEISWNSGGEIVITLQDDHDSDGFAVVHEHHSEPTDNSVVRGETPSFAGPLELPLIDILEDQGTTFPTPTFTIQFWNGSFGPWNSRASFTWYEERLGDYDFEIPEEHQRDGLFR